MESKAILFHSNKKEKCDQFISKEDFLILSSNEKDDIWLGNGMYFWDNRGNADWWNKKQKRKSPEEEFNIVVANVNLEKMLDLTDFDIYMKLEELWKHICKKIKRNSEVPLGNKLNFLFDDKFESIYSIIKVYGKYNATPSNGLFKFEYGTMRAEPTMAVKCIYNVRNAECIIEKEYID